MLKMKPHIDRDQVLLMEARRRALEMCTQHIPKLLDEHEAVTTPVREGDRIVLRIVPKAAQTEASA